MPVIYRSAPELPAGFTGRTSSLFVPGSPRVTQLLSSIERHIINIRHSAVSYRKTGCGHANTTAT